MQALNPAGSFFPRTLPSKKMMSLQPSHLEDRSLMRTRTALIAHCATMFLTAWSRPGPRRRQEDHQEEEEAVHRAARVVELVEEMYPPEVREASPEVQERIVAAEATAEANRDQVGKARERLRSTG